MAVAVAEFQGILAGLTTNTERDVRRILDHTERMDAAERYAFLTDAYPALLDPYIAAASDLTVTWYDAQPGGQTTFIPQASDFPPVEQLQISARWALGQANPVTALQGSATRAVFDQSRRTVVDNSRREGVRWARHAASSACGFCAMLATRGADYHSSDAAIRAHDHCHCTAVPDRDGSFQPPDYVARWQDQYSAARSEGASTPGQIAAAMDRIRRQPDH